MQSVSSGIWTCVVVSISYDDNHYTTGTSMVVPLAYVEVTAQHFRHDDIRGKIYIYIVRERERDRERERERCVCVCAALDFCWHFFKIFFVWIEIYLLVAHSTDVYLKGTTCIKVTWLPWLVIAHTFCFLCASTYAANSHHFRLKTTPYWQ